MNNKNETLEKLFPTVMKIKNKGNKKEEPIELIQIEEGMNTEEQETDEYGDAVTEVLATTSEEILSNDIVPFNKTQVSTMFKEDMERYMCQFNNMRRVILDRISDKDTKPAERGKHVNKLKIIDQNMNLLAKYMNKS